MSTTRSDSATAVGVRPFDAPLGAEVTGVDMGAGVSRADFAHVEHALHQHGVIVLRDQSISDEQQKRFSLMFGDELDIHPLRKFARKEHPEVFVLSNIVRDGEAIGAADAAQYWHSDLSYTTTPSRVSILYAIEVPHDDSGPLGDTEFVDTRRVWLDLPLELRQRLEGRRAFHHVAKPKKGGRSHFTNQRNDDVVELLHEVSHPVARRHPVTGETCLYVNEGFTIAIDGMDPAQSREILDHLFEIMTNPRYVYRHRWRVGDVVIWDNCLTIHQGVPNYGPTQRRLMHRTIVKGPPTV